MVGDEVRQVRGDDKYTPKRTPKPRRMFHFSTVVAVVAIFIMLTRLFRFFFILVTHFGARSGPILLFFCLFVNLLGRAFLLA